MEKCIASIVVERELKTKAHWRIQGKSTSHSICISDILLFWAEKDLMCPLNTVQLLRQIFSFSAEMVDYNGSLFHPQVNCLVKISKFPNRLERAWYDNCTETRYCVCVRFWLCLTQNEFENELRAVFLKLILLRVINTICQKRFFSITNWKNDSNNAKI